MVIMVSPVDHGVEAVHLSFFGGLPNALEIAVDPAGITHQFRLPRHRALAGDYIALAAGSALDKGVLAGIGADLAHGFHHRGKPDLAFQRYHAFRRDTEPAP